MADMERTTRSPETKATSEMKQTLYDPPSGWQYGFPKPYEPLDGESIQDTLIRDGYPETLAKELSKWTRFIGPAI